MKMEQLKAFMEKLGDVPDDADIDIGTLLQMQAAEHDSSPAAPDADGLPSRQGTPSGSDSIKPKSEWIEWEIYDEYPEDLIVEFAGEEPSPDSPFELVDEDGIDVLRFDPSYRDVIEKARDKTGIQIYERLPSRQVETSGLDEER